MLVSHVHMHAYGNSFVIVPHTIQIYIYISAHEAGNAEKLRHNTPAITLCRNAS